MLTRVKLQSNPLNVEKKLITEPSIYLQHLQLLLVQKQKKLSEIAQEIQKSVEELDSNVNLMKQKLSTLESAKKKVEDEINRNNELLERSQDSPKVDELHNKNKELEEEKQKIEQEISQKLNQINDLETSLERKEKEWNENKNRLIQKLKQFENQDLVPCLDDIEKTMQLTNSKIEASNTKLTKSMSGEMEFGVDDPFVSIGQKFQEKFVSKQDLFNENNFGKTHEEENSDNDDINFGNEEDIELEEIDEIEEIDDVDSDDGEMEFGSELEEESSESSESSNED
jgi:hypothetical protein